MYQKKKKSCTDCTGDISSVSAGIGFLANTIKKLKMLKNWKKKFIKKHII